MRTFILIVTCLLLSACGNIANVKSFSMAYEDPVAEPKARLRVISNGMVRAVPGRACIDWRVPGTGVIVVNQKGFASRNGSSLNMPPDKAYVMAPAGPGLQVSEVNVLAGQPITLHLLGQGSVETIYDTTYRRACDKAISFIPQAERDYQAVFLEAKSCSLVVSEINNGNAEPSVKLKTADVCH